MSDKPQAAALLVLLTGMYPRDETLANVINSFSDDPQTRVHTVEPENMNHTDWDELLRLILSVPKVITL